MALTVAYVRSGEATCPAPHAPASLSQSDVQAAREAFVPMKTNRSGTNFTLVGDHIAVLSPTMAPQVTAQHFSIVEHAGRDGRNVRSRGRAGSTCAAVAPGAAACGEGASSLGRTYIAASKVEIHGQGRE